MPSGMVQHTRDSALTWIRTNLPTFAGPARYIAAAFDPVGARRRRSRIAPMPGTAGERWRRPCPASGAYFWAESLPWIALIWLR